MGKLKAGLTTTSKTPNSVQVRDTFQTPNYAVDLLVPFIPKEIQVVWECAAGERRIVKRLLEVSHLDVIASDIRPLYGVREHNFINPSSSVDHPGELEIMEGRVAIITNPPFSVKDLFIEKAFEYDVPFAFLINADYSGKTIDWIRRGCQKIIPTSRIAYITPNIVARINQGEETSYKAIDEIPRGLLYKYSSAQFHSMWLTYKFNLGATEIFVDLPAKYRKENII